MPYKIKYRRGQLVRGKGMREMKTRRTFRTRDAALKYGYAKIRKKHHGHSWTVIKVPPKKKRRRKKSRSRKRRKR